MVSGRNLWVEEIGVIMMEKTSVQKLASVVRVLVIIVFACNLVALLLVPGMACILAAGGVGRLKEVLSTLAGGGEAAYFILLTFANAWWAVWMGGVYHSVMTLFLWMCGGCTAVILWQAKDVLSNIMGGRTFSDENGDRLKTAAVCCFVISAIALVYEIFVLWLYHGEAVFLTVSFMLIFVFLIAGLICLVMSALFRQAAEMKAEQDLTI